MRTSSALLSLFLFGLACSGLPTRGPAEPPAPAPAPTPELAPEPEPIPSPDTLFPALDPAEAPPFTKPSISCPPGTSVIKNPRARLRIYCAAPNGTPSGPYTEWQGAQLRIAATKTDGKLEGPYTEWSGKGSELRKISEQHYVADVPEGDHAAWDTEGRLLIRGRMHEGKRHGRFIENTLTDGELVFGGACYAAGEEVWRTTDPEEFVTRDCAEVQSEEA